ncbi:MAG: DUF4433 domain-containing protein [Acidimicrobiaceae bacterium]|nr:DUF4433 domain-containing protein [Acidimicrobiaceae bacterium]MXZ64954.1 DUF4433 domain-containing protein [Acidimicrobiaceae bacterium]MYF33432.1 DUF4433 domain-containing protein [Acidimicrobiaceae bacterium]MYG79956.1 DUF4433 domain-containing protein [Acidimicrobiaceae bacterium]MYJ82581.1 DUF4433 domain-containing protein [Acidimicrobiaceae bacterium]
MVTRRRGLLYHFTHISNLASIAEAGLYSDTQIEAGQRAPTEIGNADVKQRRRNLAVPLPPYGWVANYVPFYFAARSPMLYIISQGDVPTYSGGQDEIVYLVTSVEKVVEEGLSFVFTDRNAALRIADYGDDLEDLDDYVDWDLMEGRMWNNTYEEPDRQERRMAELLVHDHVPWSAFIGVAARNDNKCRQAEHALSSVGIEIPVRPRPGWYF